MHELGITERILKEALAQATLNGADRVTAVFLINGPLTGISDDSIRFYWELLSRETPCAGADITIEQVVAEAECLTCDFQFYLEAEPAVCPRCGSGRLHVLAGDGLQLVGMDIEAGGNDHEDSSLTANLIGQAR